MTGKSVSAEPHADGQAGATPIEPPAGGPAPPPPGGVGGQDYWGCLGTVAFGLAVLIFLPVSCGKQMPGAVGRFYRDAYKHRCDDCEGTGRVSGPCRSCQGRGYFGGVRCADCGGAGRAGQVCRFCAGSGRKPEP